MNVYLVIHNIQKIDAKLNVGDILFCKEQDSLYGYVICSMNPLTISCIGRGSFTEYRDLYFANTMIYSYKNEGARYGNIEILEILLSLFKCNPVVKKFINSLLEVLTFKEDRILTSILLELYRTADLIKPAISKTEKESSDHFLNYFSREMVEEFLTAYKTNKNMRQIFLSIRKNYPIAFRKALFEFKNNHQEDSYTIYTNLNFENCIKINEKLQNQ